MDKKSTSLDLNFGDLPLYFVENNGQTDPSVAYYVLGGTTEVYFTENGVTLALIDTRESGGTTLSVGNLARDELPLNPRVSEGAESQTNASFKTALPSSLPQKWIVKLDFVGANPVQPEGAGETEAIVSYFTGATDQWHAGLSTYSQVVYRDLWPGIDLLYYGQAGKLRYDFIIHPGADLTLIQLRYRGTGGISLTPAGQMIVSTPLGDFVDEAPVGWQVVNGKRTAVSATYNLGVGLPPENEPSSSASWENGGTDESVTYGFAVGAYDRTQPLVIDPAVLIYCGYIGGSNTEGGNGITVDSSGNTYVTGSTLSAQDSFPVTIGPDLTENGGLFDAFVVKVSASGAALVYAGYIGGLGEDYGYGIAVDGDGNAYVTGSTYSWEDSFPVKGGPDLTYNGGYNDAFVAKVSASGAALVYTGYIGGASYEGGQSIAVDNAGNAYIMGSTASDQYSFPVTVGPDLTYNGITFTDAFVAKVDASGLELVYAGYIGGSGWDLGSGIAVDGAGNVYVTGSTDSAQDSFPVKVGPDLTFNDITGSHDAFVAKVNATGSALDYAGYVGGMTEDQGRDIAVDKAGNAYITGETTSTQDSFPVIGGPDMTYNGGEKDAFVAKVKPSGSGLDYAGYVGGTAEDQGWAIAVDDAGSAYVTGWTASDQNTFPVTYGPLATYNGGDWDAFVAKVDASGVALVYAGYIGGLGGEYGMGIAVDGAGNAYVTGETSSTQDKFPVIIGPDSTYNGGDSDAFVAKISLVPWPNSMYLPLTSK